MVEVELTRHSDKCANLKLHGTVEFALAEHNFNEIVLAQTEGSESYYLHHHSLICEISKDAADELIALGAKVENLRDLKGFPKV